MATDREIIKYQQAGQASTSGATDPIGETAAVHSRQKNFTIYSSANAATNVAETPLGTLRFKSRMKGGTLTVPTTNIATSAADYANIRVYVRDNAGANQTLIATYNTGTSAVTLRVPAALTVTAANAIINANSLVTFEVIKTGAGKALDQYSLFDLLFEEV